MPDQRLKTVYDAASFLFIKKGYINTGVSEIAEKANVATGTIYNLFVGKKSILHFVLLSTLVKDYLKKDINLPVQEVDTELIIQELSEIVEEKLLSKLEKRNKDGEPVHSFTGMLSILLDCTARYQVAFNIINDNRSVLPEVENRYRQYVNHLYQVIEENLICYIERGEVRKIEFPGLHIRNIIEGITWWSMYLPYQIPEKKVPVQKAKEIALDILKHAYLTNP